LPLSWQVFDPASAGFLNPPGVSQHLDYVMSIAFVFPGQGSQSVGMGKDFYDSFAAAKETFQEVDEALGQKLSDLIFTGAAEELNMTANTQPALMAVSLAIMNTLEKHFDFKLDQSVQAVAGHSLGEYAAHAAVKSFSVADTARLLRIRGDAMQKAVPVGQGAMAAVLGLDFEQLLPLCTSLTTADLLVVPANDNCPGQVVISGHKAAVEAAIEKATAMGAKRAMLLAVSAPFHCPLMQPAADAMQEALANVVMNVPLLPIYANVTTKAESEPERLKKLLVEQVTQPVRWRETIQTMSADGFTTYVEIGAGKVLSGLNKRINSEAKCLNIATPNDIEATLEQLKA
jgi:[acyl-carrier-protein] S-malonyltransferase